MALQSNCIYSTPGINSMEQSLSCSASQEIPLILWNPKVHFTVSAFMRVRRLVDIGRYIGMKFLDSVVCIL
jgi:hypothetical protein